MCVIARDFTIMRANDAFAVMTGTSREQIIGRKCYDIFEPCYHASAACTLRRILETGQGFDTDITLHKDTARERSYILTATPLLSACGEVIGIVKNLKDITERKRLEQQLISANQTLERRVTERTQALKEREKQLIRMIYTDNLTGLPNRLRLLRDVEGSQVPVVALINIDGFEQINNFYGYAEGDFILVSLAKLLSAALPGNGYRLYRVHADEYAIFMDARQVADLPGVLDKFELLAKHITSVIPATKFTNNQQQVLLRVTMGIAFTTSADPEKLVIKADIALREARLHRKSHLFFQESAGIDARYQDNIKWAALLQDAIKHDRIVPYFQPIHNHKEPQNRHYEVLARLIDNRGNIISPFQFINIAKATKQYPAITKAIIEKSFFLFRNLPDEISINLDVEDMEDAATATLIQEQLAKYNIANRVVFEVLENHRLEGNSAAAQFLKTLKAAGCKLAVDDFGSGYSNFAYVLSLDFDYLKIDASLIKNIDQDASSQAIVKSIVTFTQDMGIKTIAEFVHSESVFSAVKNYNIDFSQGFYIAKPGPWPLNS
ncbi:Cyclic di-GMP phosphodiesterase PdeB [Sporomusa aerivorans]